MPSTQQSAAPQRHLHICLIVFSLLGLWRLRQAVRRRGRGRAQIFAELPHGRRIRLILLELLVRVGLAHGLAASVCALQVRRVVDPVLQRLAHRDTTEGLLDVAAAEGLLPDLARRLALVLDLLCTRQAAAARRVLDA